MNIRLLTPKDKKQLITLIKERGVFNEAEIQVAIEVVDEALQHPEKNDYQVFCALNDGETLMGYICIGPIPMTEGCYEIYWIAIDKRFARQGVGGKLVTFAEEFLIKKQVRRIYLDTSSTPGYTPARALYEKHGYRPICALESFYREGDHKIIFMKDMRAGKS